MGKVYRYMGPMLPPVDLATRQVKAHLQTSQGSFLLCTDPAVPAGEVWIATDKERIVIPNHRTTRFLPGSPLVRVLDIPDTQIALLGTIEHAVITNGAKGTCALIRQPTPGVCRVWAFPMSRFVAATIVGVDLSNDVVGGTITLVGAVGNVLALLVTMLVAVPPHDPKNDVAMITPLIATLVEQTPVEQMPTTQTRIAITAIAGRSDGVTVGFTFKPQ